MIPPTSDYQQAREFLECAVPWPDAGAPGYVDIISSYQKPGQDRLFWGGRAARSLNEAINAIAWLSKQPDTKGIYVCTSLQATAKQKRAKNGYEYFTPIRNQAGALALKSLFIDIDIKDGPNGYPTRKEAVKAIEDFVTAANLPQPNVVVHTGGGLHVWWVMSRALKRDDWQPLADALYEAIKRHGLRCDAGCTTDSARIMRVPNTVNRKYGDERPVLLVRCRPCYDPAIIEGALEPYKGGRTTLKGFVVPRGFETVPDYLKGETTAALNELIAGIKESKSDFPPMDEAQLNACLDAIPNPASTSRDDWLAIGAAVYRACEGADYGLDSWKRWSEQNPKYQTGDSGCEPVWRSFDYSPPTRTGAGKLVKRARLATGNPNWGLPPLQSSLNGGTSFPCGGVQSAGSGGAGGGQTNGAGEPGVVGPPAQSGHPSALAGGHIPVTPLVTTPLSAGLEYSAPTSPRKHRQWLYGIDLIRDEVTVIASPGGVGKSSLVIGMAVSLLTEKELLGETIWGKGHKVLYINGEDDREEISRRVDAFCDKHGVQARTFQGRLLIAGTDDWQMQHLSLLHTDNKTSMIDDNGIAHLESLLQDVRPDLLVIDPLVNFCGGGNMNDNAVMAQVQRALKRFAGKYNCSVGVVHHNRKGGDAESQESVSGAASIVNLSRRTITTIPMSLDEAKRLDVLPSRRRHYFRVVSAKQNLSPPTDDSPWYELTSVTLPNAEALYPTGDRVQAVVRVSLNPSANIQLTVDDKTIRRAILDVVDKGKVIGGETHPYSPNETGANNHRPIRDDAMAAIRQAIPHHQWSPGDLETVVSRAIERMLAEGWLLNEKIPKGRFRGCRALRVDWPRTLWPDGRDGAAGGEDDQDMANETAGDCHGQLRNEVSNDCPIAQAGGVGQCPPFKGHCHTAPPH